jgi:hypothetical protein
MESGPSTAPVYTLKSAKELGFKESWLQNAIRHDERLVIGPCEAGGLTDESWWHWGSEVSTKAGPIDLLLVSESGRVAIVETKLHFNPEKRRNVLAQVLDYAVNLPEEELTSLPPLPPAAGLLPSQVEYRLHQGDYLLIVAGDLLDPRAVRLGRSLLGGHLSSEWELALVEVAVYQRNEGVAGPSHLLVPNLRGTIETELRQVVKLEEGRLVVERPPPESTSGGREKWTEERFFGDLDKGKLGPAYQVFGRELQRLPRDFPGVELRWGTGKTGSLTVKRQGHGLVEFYLDGQVSFRLERPVLALGEASGAQYLAGLREIFPAAVPDEINPNSPAAVYAPISEGSLRALASLLRQVLVTAT